MTTFLIIIHTIFCVLLVTVILMQSGRGGGLTEGFSSAESMFGAKTNAFMVKLTTIFACLFLLTSVVLAKLSAKRDDSLMTKEAIGLEETVDTSMPEQNPLPDPQAVQ